MLIIKKVAGTQQWAFSARLAASDSREAQQKVTKKRHESWSRNSSARMSSVQMCTHTIVYLHERSYTWKERGRPTYCGFAPLGVTSLERP